jgi:uncharacterized RDD family membrane protein YckC
MKNIASPYLRILAWLIDFAIAVLMLLISAWFIIGTVDLTSLLNRFLILIIYYLLINTFIWPIINLFLISKLGGTIGKLATCTEIVNPKNEHISFKRAIFRNFIGYMVSGSMLWIGFIWIFIDKERRAWHDMIADTYVVVKNSSGVFLGIATLVVISLFNVFIGQRIYQEAYSKQGLYQGIIMNIKDEYKSTIESNTKKSQEFFPIQSPLNIPQLDNNLQNQTY